MYQYPYGNAQQLNLDWILSKLQELEQQGSASTIDEVANALISATYAVQNYNRSDIVFYEGKLYRANQNITAEPWTPAHWDEILLGDTVANLVQYVAALNNSQVFNSSTVAGTHTSDALNTLADTFVHYDARGIFNANDLTDTWLLAANNGVYQIQGGSTTGSFISGANTGFGELEVYFSSDAYFTYGFIVFHGTNGTVFYRDFTRNTQTNTVVWRTELKRVATYAELETKQDELTFDSVPTQNSTNPVTSGGVYNSLNPAVETPIATNVVTNMNVVLTKKGNVARIDCGITGGESVTFTKTSSGSTQTIIFAVLPVEARPPANVYFPVMIRRSGENYFDPVNIYGVLYSNGNVGINIGATVTVVQIIFGQTYFV